MFVVVVFYFWFGVTQIETNSIARKKQKQKPPHKNRKPRGLKK